MPHERTAIAEIAALLAQAILHLASHEELPADDARQNAESSPEVA